MSSTSFRASTVSTLFSRTIYSSASDLVAAGSNIPKKLKNGLKKIALAAAFSADTSLDAIELLARAIASDGIIRYNAWLCS